MTKKTTKKPAKSKRVQTLILRVGSGAARSVFRYRTKKGEFGFRVVSPGNNEITCQGEGYKTKQKMMNEIAMLWPDALPVDSISSSINDR